MKVMTETGKDRIDIPPQDQGGGGRLIVYLSARAVGLLPCVGGVACLFNDQEMEQ